MKRKGYLFQRGKKGVWYIQLVIDGKTIVKSTGATSKREAEKVRAEFLRPFALGDTRDTLQNIAGKLTATETELASVEAEHNPPPRLARIWDLFLESPSRPDSGPATLRRYEGEWDRFARWLAAKHPETEHLNQVTPAMAADYARDLNAAKLSASSYNQHRNLLRMVWRVLADECRLTVNPWDRITHRKLNSLANRKRSLTPAQFEALLNATETEPDLHDLFVLLAWTGLRRVDAVLMKWGAVDFARRVISLAPVKTARRQGKVVHIPIFPAALEVLNRRQEGKPVNPKGLVFPDMAADYERDATVLTKHVRQAFERAGIETTEDRADRQRNSAVYGCHSLRHFFVSAATAAGMPDAMIKSITGHATDGMLEHYQHLGADLAAGLADRIQSNGNAAKLPAAGLLPAGPTDTPPELVMSVLDEIRRLAKGQNAKTWKANKAAILAVLDGVEKVEN
jgi:integrase